MKAEVDHIKIVIWDRVTELFRKRQNARESEAPLGFAIRVAARWQEMRQMERFRAWERISIRAAIACSVLAIAFTGYTISDSWQETSSSVLVSPPLEVDQAEVVWVP